MLQKYKNEDINVNQKKKNSEAPNPVSIIHHTGITTN